MELVENVALIANVPERAAREAIAAVFDWLGSVSAADADRILMPLHDADYRSFLDWQAMLAEMRKAAMGE